MKKLVKLFGIALLSAIMTALSLTGCDSDTTSSGKSAGAAVEAPTLDTKTAASITINAVTPPANGQSVEYGINSTDAAPASGWHDGLTFNGLNADTDYYIFARSKENADFKAGTPSASLQVTTDASAAESVYTAGFYWDSGNNQIACYWKDGVKTDLTDSGLSDYAEARAIAVQGTDIHIAGYYVDNSSNTIPCYWKITGTGTPTRKDLTDSTLKYAYANAITVQGTDAYIAGSYYNEVDSSDWYFIACYWKITSTGTPDRKDLTDSTSTYADANAITVQGTDVYTAGYYRDNNNNSIACYWKNTDKTDLITVELSDAEAYAITVQGADVYTAGYYTDDNRNYVACYWKNKVKTDLTTLSARASAITVQGTDIYTAGYYDDPDGNTIACYWKNTDKTDLTDSGLSTWAEACAIAVQGTDVYTAGDYDDPDGNTIACYWKNGDKKDLTDSTESDYAMAYAITVVVE